jgi:hypothetical protein
MRVKSLEEFGYPKYAAREDGLIFHTGNLTFVKPYPNETGYYRVPLFNVEGQQRNVSVHKLVALSFCPGHDKDKIVNHKDNNPANNQAVNLEWVTHQENTAHCIQQGRFKYVNKKLTDEEIFFIQTSGIGLKQLTEMFHVSKSAILYHRNRGVFVKEGD